MRAKIRQHLQEADESYEHHLRFATRYSATCFKAGFMALLHGIVPSLFQKDASETIEALANRSRKSAVPTASQSAQE